MSLHLLLRFFYLFNVFLIQKRDFLRYFLLVAYVFSNSGYSSLVETLAIVLCVVIVLLPERVRAQCHSFTPDTALFGTLCVRYIVCPYNVANIPYLYASSSSSSPFIDKLTCATHLQWRIHSTIVAYKQ